MHFQIQLVPLHPGAQLGIAAALFALAPPITFGGAMIVTSRNLDAKALGFLAFIFLGVVPMVPLLGSAVVQLEVSCDP